MINVTKSNGNDAKLFSNEIQTLEDFFEQVKMTEILK